MLILDTVNKSLELVLDGVVATTQLPYISSYVDVNQSTFASNGLPANNGASNDTTPVTAVAAPSAGNSRKLNYFSVFNIDTAPAIVIIQLDDTGTKRVTFKALLAVGDQVEFTDASGWRILDSTGAIKQSGSQGVAGARGADGSIGFPGEDGIDGDFFLIPGPQGPAGSGGGGGVLTLIDSISGTDTTSTATNLGNFAISGLTILDTLYVVVKVSSAVQLTAGIKLYNVTDSVIIADLSPGGNINAGNYSMMQSFIGCSNQTVTKVMAVSGDFILNNAAGPTWADAGIPANSQLSTFTTDFTDSWTFALRHGGVVSGGTLHYSIALYKRAGQ